MPWEWPQKRQKDEKKKIAQTLKPPCLGLNPSCVALGKQLLLSGPHSFTQAGERNLKGLHTGPAWSQSSASVCHHAMSPPQRVEAFLNCLIDASEGLPHLPLPASLFQQQRCGSGEREPLFLQIG